MRRRMLAYFTAACINLSVVSGTHPATLAARPAIVRLRETTARRGRFDRRETARNGSIAVRTLRIRPSDLSPN